MEACLTSKLITSYDLACLHTWTCREHNINIQKRKHVYSKTFNIKKKKKKMLESKLLEHN